MKATERKTSLPFCEILPLRQERENGIRCLLLRSVHTHDPARAHTSRRRLTPGRQRRLTQHTRRPITKSPKTKSAQSSDDNHPAGDSATAHDSPNAAAVVSREDDKQTVWSAVPKPTARKYSPVLPVTIDGFSRQDVPDLLRQADSYAARGDYRLARYEYGLVLKLDRNNFQARERLRHLLTALQSR